MEPKRLLAFDGHTASKQASKQATLSIFLFVPFCVHIRRFIKTGSRVNGENPSSCLLAGS